MLLGCTIKQKVLGCIDQITGIWRWLVDATLMYGPVACMSDRVRAWVSEQNMT